MLKTWFKQHLFDIVFVLLITLVFSIPLFFSGLYVGHDSYYHLYRIVGTLQGLQDHQFPVRIYPYANNGFGYAAPLFYCDFFFYPFVLLYRFGLPLTTTFKLLLFSFFLLTSVLCLYVAKYLFKERKLTPYIVTILYIFSSYRIITTYVRSALGEVFSLAFIPLVLLAMYKILKEHKNNWILLGISFTFLLLSHMITFGLYCVLFLLFIVFFIIVNRKEKALLAATCITIVKGALLAIGLSAVFLFPFIEQSFSQTFSYMTAKWFEPSNINALLSVFSSSVFTNEFFSSVGGGVALLVMVVLSILFDRDKLSLFIVCIVFVTSLITTNIIDISQTTYASILQFSFRLHLLTYPLAAYLGGRVLDKCIKNKIVIYSLSILICLYSLVNMCLFANALNDNSEFINCKTTAEEIYDNNELKKYYKVNIWQIGNGEYLPSETTSDILNDTLSIKERISEYGLIDTIINGDYERNGTRFTLDFNSDKETELMLPQTYYKGYQVYLMDDNLIKLDTYSYPYFNQTTFKTVPGNHTYTCFYTGTIIQRLSTAISGISLLYLVYLIYRRKRTR